VRRVNVPLDASDHNLLTASVGDLIGNLQAPLGAPNISAKS
jgi:hypothetical protein